MGGGILLDDIHDFDLLFWFNNFIPVKKANFLYDKLSDLDIDVEDIVNASMQFKNDVIGSVRCDYLQQYKHRNIKIVAEKANLIWEFRENILWCEYAKNGKEERNEIPFHAGIANNMYVEEVSYFLNCVENNKQTFNTIEQAKQVLESIMIHI